MRAFFGFADPVTAVDQLAPAQMAALVEVLGDPNGEASRMPRQLVIGLIGGLSWESSAE